jgi:sulfatase maturation enzyme AslB (radical SAM superfamily)
MHMQICEFVRSLYVSKMEQDDQRNAFGDQSFRMIQNGFGLFDGNQSSNKRSTSGSADNSLSGSITEQLHFEPIAPAADRHVPMPNIICRADVPQLTVTRETRQNIFANELPQVIISTDNSRTTECKRCVRGPSYHHGHSKDCPKSHFAKRQKREPALSSNAGRLACRRCVIGPSYHKAHARHCPRSKCYQQRGSDSHSKNLKDATQSNE